MLKPYSSNKNQKNSEDKKDEKLTEEDKKEKIKKIIYPSGIIKITTKNAKNQIIEEEVD